MMLAACEGHTGVVDLLVHKYNCSLTEVDKVNAFDVLGSYFSVGVSCLVSESVKLSLLNVILHVVSICVGMSVTDILPMPSTIE